MNKPPFLDRLRERVLLADGATGTFLHAVPLDLERDFLGLENCMEILCQTRPDVIERMHHAYLQAGADCIETNSFGSNRVVLAEFDIADQTYALNRLAAQQARAAADAFTTAAQPRYALGSMGPGTRLASLGHIDFDALEASYAEQARGLIDGGVDALLLETHQDLLTLKAAISAIRIAQTACRRAPPIIAQVTIEATGTLLTGSDILCAATALAALRVDVIGMNCATGPAEMAEHVAVLAEGWPGPISVMPNAGLPMLVDGQTEYPLAAAEMAEWLLRFVDEDGVNLVGGCCGSTPAHIAAIRALLDARADAAGAKPKRRDARLTPAVTSLYAAVPLRQENALFSIGERSNASGSRRFRRLLEAGDQWDALTAIGRAQEREGSHALDVSVACVGRDETRDMVDLVSRYRGALQIPLIVDSTEPPVVEAALKLIGGKATINSINFEDGEERPATVLGHARKYGAAVIALTIDEQGMAKTAAEKLRIARRLYAFAVERHGLSPADLLFDPLTFTIATGMESDRRLGIETLDAIEGIAREFPECQIALGLSNISFGLNPAARHVLNSVFLHHARERGLTAAILHLSSIVPLHRIDAAQREAAEALIFDRRDGGVDPLLHFIKLFEGVEEATPKQAAPTTIEEALTRRIVDGDREGLAEDVERGLKKYAPLEIINTLLLDGMRTVGELFGAGKMQLPFVLQSAETMKAAVALLEPHMERSADNDKGVLVIATVRGDVHDIGKNLVDIILTNNGYRVVNLGVKQPIATILDAAREHNADAVGMSGLLVKSTVIMKENLAEMRRRALHIPVLLGGAALTRRYVEGECQAAYDAVHYARDAFSGLRLMEQIVDAKASDAAA